MLYEVGIAAHIGCHYRQAAGHRLQNGIGDAFSQRRQGKRMQAAHDDFDICALTGQPGQMGGACGFQDGQGLCTQRTVTDHDQAQTIAQQRGSAQGEYERVGQHDLVLHSLHAANGSHQPMLSRIERASRNPRCLTVCRSETGRVHTVVGLRDRGLRDINLFVQIDRQVA